MSAMLFALDDMATAHENLMAGLQQADGLGLDGTSATRANRIT